MLPGGVAVLDAKAENVHTLSHQAGKWTALSPHTVSLNLRKGDSQLVWDAGSMLLRGKSGWQTQALHWQGKARRKACRL